MIHMVHTQSEDKDRGVQMDLVPTETSPLKDRDGRIPSNHRKLFFYLPIVPRSILAVYTISSSTLSPDCRYSYILDTPTHPPILTLSRKQKLLDSRKWTCGDFFSIRKNGITQNVRRPQVPAFRRPAPAEPTPWPSEALTWLSLGPPQPPLGCWNRAVWLWMSGSRKSSELHSKKEQ